MRDVEAHEFTHRLNVALHTIHQRPSGWISNTVERVSHVEDMRFGFAGGIFQWHLRNSSSVVKGSTADSDAVVSYDGGLIHFAANGGARTRNTRASGIAGCWGFT